MPLSLSYRITDRFSLSINLRDAIALIIWGLACI